MEELPTNFLTLKILLRLKTLLSRTIAMFQKVNFPMGHCQHLNQEKHGGNCFNRPFKHDRD